MSPGRLPPGVGDKQVGGSLGFLSRGTAGAETFNQVWQVCALLARTCSGDSRGTVTQEALPQPRTSLTAGRGTPSSLSAGLVTYLLPASLSTGVNPGTGLVCQVALGPWS